MWFAAPVGERTRQLCASSTLFLRTMCAVYCETTVSDNSVCEQKKEEKVARLRLYNPPSQTLSGPYHGGTLVPYIQNVPLWSHLQCECISSFFARVSILYLKPFVFPQLVPGAVLDESNRGSICNRGATYCKDRESNSRMEEESEQLLILEKMTEILAYAV